MYMFVWLYVYLMTLIWHWLPALEENKLSNLGSWQISLAVMERDLKQIAVHGCIIENVYFLWNHFQRRWQYDLLFVGYVIPCILNKGRLASVACNR